MNNELIKRSAISESSLFDQYRIGVSNTSISIVNITAEEAVYIQRYPMLNGLPHVLSQHIGAKLTSPSSWLRLVRPPEKLNIELHSIDDDAYSSICAKLHQNGVPRPSKFDLWSVAFFDRTGDRVLVAGSMSGYEPILMRAIDNHQKIFTLDILSDNAVASQEKGFISCTADIHSLPYLSDSFDLVYNNNVMEHLYNNIDECMQEIYRTLRPGGALCFVMPTEANGTNPDKAWQDKNVGRSHNWWLVDPGHPWKTDLHDIRARLLGAGFAEPKFAYYDENLEYCASAMSQRAERSSMSSLFGHIFDALAGAVILQDAEKLLRRWSGFYGYRNYKNRIRNWFGLPNRHRDSVQVAVVAHKPRDLRDAKRSG